MLICPVLYIINMAHYKGLFRLKLFSWFVAINSFLGKSTNPAMFQELSRISNADAIEFFISELPENGIFIDIGANLGVITEEILKVKRCNAILFEPIPEYANHIRIKFRGNDNVVIENVALGDSTGNFSLYKDKVTVHPPNSISRIKPFDLYIMRSI